MILDLRLLLFCLLLRFRQVIDSRYFKLKFKLHEVKNAVLAFPTVVLEVRAGRECDMNCD